MDLTRRRITVEPGRFASWRLFSDGQFVGVMEWHRSTGYLALNGKWGKYDFRDAVDRHVGRYGLDEPSWFERSVSPRRQFMEEDDMAHAMTKRLPKQITGKHLVPDNPSEKDLEVIAKINDFAGITWEELGHLFRSRKWQAGPPVELYTDGGLCGQNGSAPAGTWAWVAVDAEGRLAAVQSGVFTAEQIKKHDVSNNSSEVAAIIRALAFVPQLWTGRVNTDSAVALTWILGEVNQEDYQPPPAMVPFILRTRQKVFDNKIEFRLVKGHASQNCLDAGISYKNGLPTAPWNNLVDLLCTAQYLRWKADR